MVLGKSARDSMDFSAICILFFDANQKNIFEYPAIQKK